MMVVHARDMTVGLDSWLPVVAKRQSGPLINALLTNVKKKIQRIGWRPQVDFAEGLRKTIDWPAASRW